MTNYIILNGTNSNTINGLLIQELSPISKPAIRTEVEEIDGRDGDIVTKLGYSAYDKDISIGLYGNFDINEVISFFNSEGVVIFSNEPDKYYNYQIINQIDFERLLRFRTANVTMHCQPFKYSATEGEISLNGTIITGEGTDLELVNTEEDGSFIDLELKGNTFQQAYSGKQLFDKDNANIINCSVNSSGITATSAARTIYIPCEKNTTYTISKIQSARFRCGTTIDTPDAGVAFANYISSDNSTSITITTDATSNYIFAFIYISTVDTLTEQQILDSIQIEKGSTATEYEPYVGGTPSPNPDYPQDIKVVTGNCSVTISNEDNTSSQIYPINLGTIELCELDQFQDYIYKDSGKWYIHKEIGKVVLDGTETWALTNTQPNNTTYKSMAHNFTGKIPGNTNMLMTHFTNMGTSSTNLIKNANSEFFWNNPSTNNVQGGVVTTSQTVADFKTWLSTHNTEVYYVLETPTDTEITDATLISQLNALGDATTYLGTTNIITSGSDMPPIIYVQTYAVENPVINVTNNGNIYSKPNLTIYGQGNIALYLNGSQVFNIALGNEQYITIDVADMEATQDGVLKNRLVTGDYDNFVLQPGENEITFTGALYSMTIEDYSRWV